MDHTVAMRTLIERQHRDLFGVISQSHFPTIRIMPLTLYTEPHRITGLTYKTGHMRHLVQFVNFPFANTFPMVGPETVFTAEQFTVQLALEAGLLVEDKLGSWCQMLRG